jgi:hypothetical protein
VSWSSLQRKERERKRKEEGFGEFGQISFEF